MNCKQSRREDEIKHEGHCPTEEQLRQLMSGEMADAGLTDAEQERLTAHLDGCPECCERISHLAGSVPVSGVPAANMSAPDESALLSVVERIKADSPTNCFGSGTTEREAVLDFLASSDDPSLLGRLGRFAVMEEVGRGANGIVLKAHDEALGRIVALKVLSPRLATNEHARRRFVREARAAAAIRDDHVIGIHGVDEASGLPFLVMEFIVGRSLAERLEADGSLPVADILRIGGQIARGLAAAHAQGLVHRDIKPANILLENGVERVKITDFGLAHAVDDVRTTQAGVVIGTPEYMSPEQARGEKVDHRSDLFSLGCVLYAMSAGRPPFRAESTMAVLRRVCEDTPRPLAEINPETSVWLADVIDKLIAKNAAERFSSAAEVAELLGQYLAHVQQPEVIPRPAPIAKPRPVRPHAIASAHRRWLTAATAAMLLLCAGLSLAETTGMTDVVATVIRIVRGDGTLVVEIDDPNIQVLIDGEELVISGAGPKEIRLRPGQHELHTVKDGKPVETKLITITRDGRQLVKVAREQAAPAGPTTRQVWADAVAYSPLVGAASPDGKYLAYVDWQSGHVAVRELATGTSRRLSNQGHPELGLSPIFSPDSKQVAYYWLNKDEREELRTSGLDGSNPRVVYHTKETERRLLLHDWSVDGKHILATFHKEGAVHMVLVAVMDGSVRVLKTMDMRLEGNLRLSPDGRYVAYTDRPQQDSPKRDIFLLATDGSGEAPLMAHPADDRVLAWAPNGKQLIFASDRTGSMGIWLIAVAEGKPQGVPVLVKSEMGQFNELGLTRSGSFYYEVYSGGRNVYTATLDLEKGKLLTPPVEAMQREEGSNWAPAWSPDGRYLACLSHRQGRPPLFFIRSLESKEVRELAPNLRSFNVHSLHWSPDGRALLGAGNYEEGEGEGALRVDVETGAVTTLVRPAHAPFLAPDGKALFYQKSLGMLRRFIRRDLQTGVEQELYQSSNPNSERWALSTDGRQLAFAAVGGAVNVMPATGGEARELTKGEGSISTIAWTPDGQYLVAQRWASKDDSKQQPELWRIPVAGGEPRKLEIDLPALHHLRIHPDGRQIAFMAKSLQAEKTEVWVLENFLPPLTEYQAAEEPPAKATIRP